MFAQISFCPTFYMKKTDTLSCGTWVSFVASNFTHSNHD